VIEGWVMKKTWKRETEAKRREGSTFVTHPCIDCLRMIRWEGYRCFECEGSFRASRAHHLNNEGERDCQVCGSYLEAKSRSVFHCPRCSKHPKRRYRN
jgi:hypothetical protein